MPGTFMCPLKLLESTGKQGEDRGKDVDAIPAHHIHCNIQFLKVLKGGEVGKCGLQKLSSRTIIVGHTHALKSHGGQV